MRPILPPVVAAVAATAGCIALVLAPDAALAQMTGMTCFTNVGGRATCVESNNSLIDRMSADASARQAANVTVQRRLVRKVAEAVRDGRCADALELALKATDPMVAAS